MKKRIMMGIGLAALLLAGVAKVDAQQTYFIENITNTAFVTPYTLTNGVSAWNTNNPPSLTNNQALYSPSTALPFSLRNHQNVPSTFGLISSSSTNGPATALVGLDLSHDNVNWFSNVVTLSTSDVNNTNQGVLTVPLINGTNAFTGFEWARWGYASYSGNTNAIIWKFYRIVFR